jgi:hypothetical protein
VLKPDFACDSSAERFDDLFAEMVRDQEEPCRTAKQLGRNE